jgi:NTE family protein
VTANAPAEARPRPRLALVLSGGGARAAYQIGTLRFLARARPGLRIPLLTGVSAGAINASYLAAHPGPLGEAVEGLSRLWSDLHLEEVFRANAPSLAGQVLRWLARLGSGGSALAPEVRGMVDTTPLRRLLERELGADGTGIPGIRRHVERGDLEAVALTAINYSTGQTVTFVQGCELPMWERPNRVSVCADLKVGHVLASAALPLFFPAVRIGDAWYGDGGVRHAAPLSPALHLGADRILAVSTRYRRSRAEAEAHATSGYPPPAQILSVMLNAVFLDVIDQDHERMQKVNALLAATPPELRGGLRQIDVVLLRPSRDLGRMAADFEPRLPSGFRFLTRGLGTRETASPDLLSLVLFERDYLRRLIEIGEADAAARAGELLALVDGEPLPAPRAENALEESVGVSAR